MKLRLVLTLMACVIGGSASAADCATELKSSDGFKELSAKLKCLEDRIKALEGSRADKHAMPAAPPAGAAKGSSRISFSGVEIALEKCARLENRDVYCKFSITNPTEEDKKVCFQYESRIVADTGASFSQAMYQSVGSVQNNLSGSACDLVPPRVKASGWIQFHKASEKVDGKLQLVRLNCGGGCVLNAYDVPVQ